MINTLSHLPIHRILNQPFTLRMDDAYENTQFLLKYSPKFYTRVEFDISELQNKKIMRKTKLIKIIKFLYIKNYSPKHHNLIKQTFAHHKHQIHSINLPDPSLLKCFPKITKFSLLTKDYTCWRAFLHLIDLKTLLIEFSSNMLRDQSPTEREKYALSRYLQWRLWNHLTKLKILKNIYIQIYNKFDRKLHQTLNRFNNCKPLLESLQTLSLFLHHLHLENVEEELNFLDIFQKITVMKIHEVPFATLQSFLTNIESFQSLTSLCILQTIGAPGVLIYEEKNVKFNVDFAFLQRLKSLEKLRILELAFNLSSPEAITSFLNNLTMPAQIQKIKLNFCETNWKSIIQQNDKSFEENANLLNFYAQWKNLPNLDSLSLCFAEGDNSSNPSSLFISHLLKNLTTLSTLYYADWSSMDSGKKKAIDFNYFLQNILHLKNTLKKLHLETFSLSLRKLPNITIENPLLQLQEMSLCAFILGDAQFKTLFHLFPKSSTSSSLLELERVIIDDEKSYKAFLQDIMLLPKNLQATVNIDLRKIDAETFINETSSSSLNLPKKTALQMNFYNVPILNSLQLKKLKALLVKHRKVNHYVAYHPQEDRMLVSTGEIQEIQKSTTSISPRLGIEDEANKIFGSIYSEGPDDDEDDDGDLGFEEFPFNDKFEDIDEDFEI